MKFCCILAAVFVLTIFQAIEETATDETLQVNFFNRGFKPTPAVMCAMLKRAQLAKNGFTKDVILVTKLDQGSQDDQSETTYLFYKHVNCSYKAMQEIGQELNNSLPGTIGEEMTSDLKKEVKFRHLDNAGLCKMGVKVGFKGSLGCELKRKKRNTILVRRPRKIRIRIRIRINIRITVKKQKKRR